MSVISPTPTFADRCFALSQEQTRRAAQCSGQRQVYRQLIAYGFYTAGLYHLGDGHDRLRTAPTQPEGEYDWYTANRWQAQAERGDLQGSALWLATFQYERDFLAKEACSANLADEDECEAMFFSRWQDDLCRREYGAVQRLTELLDPELARQHWKKREDQEIPAEE